MWKEKVIAEAKKQQKADSKPMRNELDWYIYRFISRMPTEDFVKLFDEVVGLTELFDMRMSNGLRIRHWVRDLVAEAFMEDDVQ